MNRKHLALALALTGALATGAAHAGGQADVQWSVTIGSPRVGLVVGAPVYAPGYAPRVYEQRVVERYVQAPRYHYPQPVVVVPQRSVYRAGWRDDDRDGIPNRYDRHYNPRWDRDGDGIPNRYDRHDHHGHHGYHGYRDGDRDGRDGRDNDPPRRR